MQITVDIDGKQQALDVPDDATPEEIDQIVNAGSAPAAAAAPQGVASNANGIALNVLNGLSFGFNDEMGGLTEALVKRVSGDKRPLSQIYHESQQKQEGEEKGYQAAHPIAAGASEAVGNFIPAVAATLAGAPEASPIGSQIIKEGSTALRRIGRGAGLGGAAGGVAGVGNSEVGQEMEGGVTGAAGGAVLGGAVPGALEFASPVVKGLRKAGSWLTGLVDNAEAPATAAEGKILQGMQRDNMTPAMAADDMRAQQQLGKPVGIVDVGGQNLKGTARAAATLPGPGKQTAAAAIDTRADQQLGRVLGDVEQGVGVPVQDSGAVAESIVARRKAMAAPLYQAAEAKPLDLTSPGMQALLKRPTIKRAMRQAERNLQDEGGGTGHLARIDAVKRVLDGKIGVAKRSGDNEAVRRFTMLKQQMLEEVDRQVPEFAAARKVYAGESELADALEDGRGFLKMDPRAAGRTIEKLTEGEREMFRVGAVDAIRNRASQAADNADHANIVKSIFGWGKDGAYKRELMEKLFPSKNAFEQFEARMQSELEMVRTRNHVAANSNTATKLAEQDDMGDSIATGANMAVDAAGGNMKGALMRGARAVTDHTLGRLRSGLTESTRGEVSKQLFNFTEAEQAEDFLQRLERLRQKRQDVNLSKRLVGDAAGFLSGEIAGQ